MNPILIKSAIIKGAMVLTLASTMFINGIANVTGIDIEKELEKAWEKGVYKEYKWDAKVYDNPSKYGIDDGRVSKLYIRDKDGNEVVNYDRGWDIKPKNKEIKEVVDHVLKKFPNPEKVKGGDVE